VGCVMMWHISTIQEYFVMSARRTRKFSDSFVMVETFPSISTFGVGLVPNSYRPAAVVLLFKLKMYVASFIC